MICGASAYIQLMPRKPIELPPAVARRFVDDMRAYFAEKNGIKRDEIAARQLHALRQHHTGKLRLTDVKEMFVQMRDDIYLTRVSLARVLGLRKHSAAWS